MSFTVFEKECSNDAILVLAKFFRIGRVFHVFGDFFPYWPSLFRIGRVCHRYDASRFCDTNAIFMKLINKHKYFLSFNRTHTCHHANMSVRCIPPYTPLLYSKIGVYRGILYFLIFALKHRR